MNLVRKYLNYLVFGAVVLGVVFLAVSHSSHLRGLVAALGSSTPSVRSSAAQELIRGEQYSDSVTGEPVEVRLQAVGALETLGNDVSVTYTPPKDPDDKTNPDLRAAAVTQCLGFLKGTDKSVRDRAVAVLKKIGDSRPENLKALIAGLGDGDASVRKGATAALADADGVGPQPGVVEAVVGRIQADAPSRGPGGTVLGSKPFQTREARDRSLKGLIAILTTRDDKDPAKYKSDEDARAGACDALGKIGDARAVLPLQTAMGEGSQVLRPAAIGAIALIADASGEPSLVEALKNPADDTAARAQAAAGLGKIGSPLAVSTLVNTLSDQDLKLRSAAVAALARAARPTLDAPTSPKVVSALIVALGNSSPETRLGAAQALQTVGTPQVNVSLIKALQTDDEDVRAAAATALGFKGNKEAVHPLMTALSDPSGAVKTAARDALVAIGPAAIDSLISALRQGGTDAYYASQAIVRQGASALPALKRAAQSSSPVSERWAAVALGDLGAADPETKAILNKLAVSTDPDVSYVAQEQLGRLFQTQ